jgi:predicted DNA-binding transcriptional regulator AlpA
MTEHNTMARTLRMITRRDLRERKGIPYSRQHISRLIDEGKFPPPDGKTADTPTAPNWWYEHTIDAWLRKRARGHKGRKAAAEATA